MRNIFIATPAFAGQVYMNYLTTLIDFLNTGIPFTVNFLGNESLITRARNTLITDFYNKKQFSHLLFLDADVGVERSGLLKLLNSEKDVIAAPVPLKMLDEKKQRVFSTFNVKEKLTDSLWEVEYAATGVFLLSRKAVEDLVK